ncbi:MAG: PepSY-associated TM helix domain-containing protein [Draconibacterium sp.]
MNIRKLLRTLHRDLGYYIVAMTLVYAVSGIYLNHRHDFNPDYKIYVTDFQIPYSIRKEVNDEGMKKIIENVNEDIVYKKHYVNKEGLIKIFIENGEAVINPETGKGTVQYLKRRPLIFSINKLHRASIGTLWKWVSDIMALILIFVAISGLFLLKGKKGFGKWGWWWTIAGIVVPLIFALLFI